MVSSTPKVVLSCFGPYGPFAENPTETVAKAVEAKLVESSDLRMKLYWVTFRATFREVLREVSSLIAELRPTLWVGLGLKSAGTGVLRIECKGTNLASPVKSVLPVSVHKCEKVDPSGGWLRRCG